MSMMKEDCLFAGKLIKMEMDNSNMTSRKLLEQALLLSYNTCDDNLGAFGDLLIGMGVIEEHVI